MKIPLRKKDGSVRAYAVVDGCDFEYLNQFRWYLGSKGYVRRNKWINGKYIVIRMHHEIAERMGLDMSNTIDHKDRVRLNNRRENLRPATRLQQQANRGKHRNNSSDYPGVSWSKQAQKYRAQISINGKLKHLGLFEDKFEAALVYALQHQSEFGKFSPIGKYIKIDLKPR